MCATVAQVLLQPPCTLDALCSNSDDDAAASTGTTAALGLPSHHTWAASAAAQRVQVVLRGQRFEMAMDVATEYCLLFRFFFGLPLTPARLSTQDASVQHVLTALTSAAAAATAADTRTHDADEHSDAQGGTTDRHTAFVRRGGGDDDDDEVAVYPATAVMCDTTVAALPQEALSRLWLAHYTDTVRPRLEHGVAVLTPHASMSPCLPTMAQPVSIDYDASTHVWRFTFLRRLPDAAAAATTEATTTATTTTTTDATTLDRNANPQLLLQPDYMGVLVAWLRRAQQQSRPLPLPLRWQEMNYDAQLSLVLLIRALGLGTLLRWRCLAAPTASRTTSQFAPEDADSHIAPHELHEQTTTTTTTRAEHDTEVKNDGDSSDDDDDDLVAPASGCHVCGRAGHAAADCPFVHAA